MSIWRRCLVSVFSGSVSVSQNLNKDIKYVGRFWAEIVRDLLRLTVMMFRMLLVMSSVVLTVIKIKNEFTNYCRLFVR